jgi:hypothetical protein
MRPVVLTKALVAASANNICLSQTPAGAGAITLNGSTVTGGVATLDTQRRVLATTAGADSGKTLVLTGTDIQGNTITETLTLPSASTVASTRDFYTITSAVVSAALAGAITVGTNTTGSTVWVPMDINGAYGSPIGIQCTVTGTVTYTVEYSQDDPFNYVTAFPLAFSSTDTGVVSATTSKQSVFSTIPRATRLTITAGTGSVVYTVIHTSLAGA